MAKVQISREVAAPREEVWALLANPSRYEDWLTVHSKWSGEPPTEITKDGQFTEVVTIMGMPNTITWTVEEYEPPSNVKISGTGMAGAKVSFTMSVRPEGATSVIGMDAEFVSQMVVGAIGKAIERAATQEITTSLDNLARLIG